MQFSNTNSQKKYCLSNLHKNNIHILDMEFIFRKKKNFKLLFFRIYRGFSEMELDYLLIRTSICIYMRDKGQNGVTSKKFFFNSFLNIIERYFQFFC